MTSIHLRLALLFLIKLTSATHAATSEVIVQEIKSLGISTKQYETVLELFFAEAYVNGDITASINLSADYNSQAINVIVIAEPQSAEVDRYIQSLGISQSAVSQNFAAVNDDLLLVGESALAQSYMSSFNEVLSILHAENLIGTMILGDPYQYHQAMTTYLDFGNISALRSVRPRRYNEGGAPWGQDPLATLRRMALNDVELTPFIYVTFSFIFQHELAHLENGVPGSFSNFGQLIQDFYDWRILRAETSADAEAFDRISEIVSRNKESVDIYSIVGLANNLRNQLLHRYFDGISGISARDRFVSLMHNGCDNVRADSYGLRRDNVEMVMAGYLSPLPILTSEEYLKIQASIARDARRVTHPHNLVRAEEIVAELDVYTEDSGIPASFISNISEYLAMLRALESGEPYVSYEYFGSQTGIEMTDFLTFTAQHFDVQSSMSCAADLACFVGISDAGDRIEFASTEGKLVYATFYLAIDAPYGSVDSGSVSPIVVDSLLDFMSVPSTIVDQRFNVVTPQGVAEDAASELTSCGFHWSMYFSLDGFIEIATLEPEKSLQIRLFPAGYDVFRTGTRG